MLLGKEYDFLCSGLVGMYPPKNDSITEGQCELVERFGRLVLDDVADLRRKLNDGGVLTKMEKHLIDYVAYELITFFGKYTRLQFEDTFGVSGMKGERKASILASRRKLTKASDR